MAEKEVYQKREMLSTENVRDACNVKNLVISNRANQVRASQPLNLDDDYDIEL
jgi:hypothetical protein